MANTKISALPSASSVGPTDTLPIVQGGVTKKITVYQGTATNDNAAAGQIGEYISSTVAVGSAISMTTTVAVTITSISLTAGDWDVTGSVDFHPGATTTSTYQQGGVSIVNNTLGAQDTYFSNTFAIATTAIDAFEVVPTVRLSLSGTTTVYLVAVAGFAISTMVGYGTIRARRIR